MAAKKPATIGTAKRRPNLYLAESRLARAFGALEEIDPDLELSPAEHEQILATYVNVEDEVGVRDEFVDFCRDVDGVIAAKKARAAELTLQAKALEKRLETMTQGVARMMEAQGLDEMRGHDSVIVLARSRGAVDVIAPELVPREFTRVPDSIWMQRVSRLVELVEELGHTMADDLSYVSQDGRVLEARAIAAEADAELRVTDKVAVQEAWRAAGGSDTREVLDTDAIEALEAARSRDEITQEQLIEQRLACTKREPIVPGCAKVVTLSLKFK